MENDDHLTPSSRAEAFEKCTKTLKDTAHGRVYESEQQTPATQVNFVAPTHIQPASYGGPVINIDFNALNDNMVPSENTTKPTSYGGPVVNIDFSALNDGMVPSENTTKK